MNTVRYYAKLSKVDTTVFTGIHLRYKISSANQRKRIPKESEETNIQNPEV